MLFSMRFNLYNINTDVGKPGSVRILIIKSDKISQILIRIPQYGIHYWFDKNSFITIVHKKPKPKQVFLEHNKQSLCWNELDNVVDTTRSMLLRGGTKRAECPPYEFSRNSSAKTGVGTLFLSIYSESPPEVDKMLLGP